MNENSERFPEYVEARLRKAGWFPGRQVEKSVLEPWYAFKREYEPGYCMMFPAAWRVLREFGGLSLLSNDPDYMLLMDPSQGHGSLDGDSIMLQWWAGHALYPLGVMYEDHAIAISSQGSVYAVGPAAGFVLLGSSFDEALIRLHGGELWNVEAPSPPPEVMDNVPDVIKAVQRLWPEP